MGRAAEVARREQLKLNKTEQEAIILNAVWSMIDDMVNFEMFEKLRSLDDTNLVFSTSTHMRLFNILLGDFLSLPQRRGQNPLPFGLPAPPDGTCDSDRTFLFYLKEIVSHPELGGDIDHLRKPLTELSSWLEEEATITNVWLPSVDTEVDLKLRRIVYLKICGDIAKHNFARLEVNVRKIRRILAEHGHPIDEGLAYATLPEFYEWFHTHLLGYHYSTIAEFLNNLRWGIFRYIRPEFERAYEAVEPAPMYRFNVPPNVTNSLATALYWDLLDKARSEPYFPIFTVTPSLKQRY